jgi:hypothetical protein
MAKPGPTKKNKRKKEICPTKISWARPKKNKRKKEIYPTQLS